MKEKMAGHISLYLDTAISHWSKLINNGVTDCYDFLASGFYIAGIIFKISNALAKSQNCLEQAIRLLEELVASKQGDHLKNLIEVYLSLVHVYRMQGNDDLAY